MSRNRRFQVIDFVNEYLKEDLELEGWRYEARPGDSPRLRVPVGSLLPEDERTGSTRSVPEFVYVEEIIDPAALAAGEFVYNGQEYTFSPLYALTGQFDDEFSEFFFHLPILHDLKAEMASRAEDLVYPAYLSIDDPSESAFEQLINAIKFAPAH